MEWHKSFEKQAKECDRAGKRWPILAPYSREAVIVCVQRRTYCHSKACKDVRHGMSPVGEAQDRHISHTGSVKAALKESVPQGTTQEDKVNGLP